jgi:hypothetical protein
LKGPDHVEITSPTALSSITATVSFTNDLGQTGSVAATVDGPTISASPSGATLVIQTFTVSGWYDHGLSFYWPKLTLTETSGRSSASINKINFELLDIGSSGRVPPDLTPRAVPAGGTISLDDDGYGPWFEISSTADASRVSVVISFVDDAGRGGSVSAIAPVSR